MTIMIETEWREARRRKRWYELWCNNGEETAWTRTARSWTDNRGMQEPIELSLDVLDGLIYAGQFGLRWTFIATDYGNEGFMSSVT